MCTCRSEASSGQLMVPADGEAAGGAGGAQVRAEMKARAGEGDGDMIGEKQER